MFYAVLLNMMTLCILMAVGFLVRKLKILNDEGTSGLASMLISVTLPALTIMSMQKPFSQDLLFNSIVTIGVSIIIHFICYAIGLFACRFMKLNISEKKIFIFAITFSNMVYMGFPIIRDAYGEESMFYGAMGNIVFNILVSTLGVKIISSGSGKGEKFDFKKLANPVIVSAILGLIFFVLSIEIYAPLGRALTMMGNMTTPLSMIIIGSLLAKSDFKSLFIDYRLYILSLIRLIIIPAIIFVGFKFILKDDMMLNVLTVFAGMPAASITAVYAEKFDADPVFASKVVFFTTIMSVLTIPLMIYFIG